MRGPSTLNAALTVVTIALMTGIPVSPETDHDGDHAHLEHGHDGHDHVVMVEEGRLPVSSFVLVGLPAVSAPAPCDSKPFARMTIDNRDCPANFGRDPPTPGLPRPPPSKLS